MFITALGGAYPPQQPVDAQAQLSIVISTFNDRKTFKSDNVRYERTIAEARTVKARYGSLPAGQIAQYYIALSEDNLGHTDKAVQELEELIQIADPTMKA